MNREIRYKNITTGKLLSSIRFTRHGDALKGRSSLEAAGKWNHVAVDRHGNELPYYFSHVPMYAIRNNLPEQRHHQLPGWYESPGRAARAFQDVATREAAEGLRFADRIIPEWVLVDHRGDILNPNHDRFWRSTVPQEAGQFALWRSFGGDDFLFLKSTRTAWCKSKRGLCLFAKGRPFPRKGVNVIHTLGQGIWETWPNYSPWD